MITTSRAGWSEGEALTGYDDRGLRRDLLACLDTRSPGAAETAERHRKVEALVRLADGDRAGVEALRAHYVHRLHQRSDDFIATEALRVIEAALAQMHRAAGLWAWQRREQAQRPGRWRRRRARRRTTGAGKR